MGPTHAHDYRSGGSDRTEDLGAYVANMERAKEIGARTWLLEMVEFGSVDVAVAVWRENEEGVRASWEPAGEAEIRNRAIRAEARREASYA